MCSNSMAQNKGVAAAAAAAANVHPEYHDSVDCHFREFIYWKEWILIAFV